MDEAIDPFSLLDESNVKEKKSRDHRKSYTCSFKLKVVDYAEKYSNSKAAESYGVHRRRVQEWKNQKERLVEQVNNFNGSTKRLKGGGRKMKIQQDEEKMKRTDAEIEPYLTEHLKGYAQKNELTPEIVLKEAKKINPKMKRGKEWADEFLDDFLINQPPPLQQRLDRTPPPRHGETLPRKRRGETLPRKKNYETSTTPPPQYHETPPKRRRYVPSFENSDDYSPKYLDPPFASSYAEDYYYYYHSIKYEEERYHDEFFDKVEKDESNLIKHLVKWVQSFVDNYLSRDPIDVRTLQELVYKEARNNAVLFDVTIEWARQFLELHKNVYASKCKKTDDDSYNNERIEDETHKVSGTNRQRVLCAMQNKEYTIHEWMDSLHDAE